MRLKTVVAMAVSLFMLGTASAQLSAAQIGAVVDNVRFEKGTRLAFVRIVNNSNKDITGFNLSIDVTYQNGQQYHYERMVDLLQSIILRQRLGLDDDGALHPQGRYEERLDLPSRGSSDNLAVAVSAKLDVVAYFDATADVVENGAALARLSSFRRNCIIADQKAAEIINAAAANTVTPDARGMAVNQLRTLMEQAKHKTGDHASETELAVIIADLERSGSEKGKSSLIQYARDKYGDSQAMSAHALLRRSR